MENRFIDFEAISNFRDLGGYPAGNGQEISWRRLFRSAELYHMTSRDLTRLKEELGIAAVMSLQDPKAQGQGQEASLLNSVGIKYYRVPFPHDIKNEPYQNFSHMGEVYLYRINQKKYSQQIIEALDIIAEPENHPLVFHCSAGKDRSGILAALVLSLLGVPEKFIIEDYMLSAPYMNKIIQRLKTDPDVTEDVENLPNYTWEATAESMAWFLSAIEREYGSARDYVLAQGADVSLIQRLGKILLFDNHEPRTYNESHYF